MSCRISVITPVFNVPLDFVREAIRSVKDQNLGNDVEHIVWDDGSRPAYVTDLTRLAQQEGGSHCWVGHNPVNLGIRGARSAAIERANGDWIVFLDADDFLGPGLLSALAMHTVGDADLLYTDHILTDSTGERNLHVRNKNMYQRLHERYHGTLLDPLLHCTFIFHCQAYRRSTLARIGGLTSEYASGDEVDAHLRIAEMSSRVTLRHVPGVVYYYRDNPQSVCHDAAYYATLIGNIESMLVDGARRRGYDVVKAIRIGRAKNTHAAHYRLQMDDGSIVALPWFDVASMTVRDATKLEI